MPQAKLVICLDRPKMQLSKNCPVTPEFRAEMNAWMLEFFGTTHGLRDGQTHMTRQHGDVYVYVSARHYAQMTSQLPRASTLVC